MALEIIQIIEDDPAQARLLDQALRRASFRTNVAHDGPPGMQDVWRIKPALVLLDENLPSLSGHEICRRLRRDPSTRHIPIIMLSGFASEERRIAGLDSGADDYITKPYATNEMIARVRALLRRSRQSCLDYDEEPADDLVLEGTMVLARYRGKRLTLSGQEWKVLSRLAATAGTTVPREELRALLWEDDNLLHDTELDRCLQQLALKLAEEETVAAIQPMPGGAVRLSVSSKPAGAA